MKKFEYKILKVMDEEFILNNLGKQGWELTTASIDSITYKRILIFKRELLNR